MDVTSLRKHFPALDKKQIYFDNAGGSQCLQEVIDRITSYLTSSNVQLGASYPIAQTSTQLYGEGKSAAAKYINAYESEVVLGPSTTQLFRNLSTSLSRHHLKAGDEIILSKLDHEANVASWLQLAAWQDLKIIWWTPASKTNPVLDSSELASLMTPRTKLVACTHTSNILGSISPIRAIADVVHSTTPGALLCVDAVAYAPHRAIDVKALGVDFYSFSWYKVYGAHIAMLYASTTAQKCMESLGHYFKGSESLEDKLGLAGANYELVASVPSVCEYLANVPWEQIAAHEEKITKVLIDYLVKKGCRIWGEPSADQKKRVPVISFTVEGRKSKNVVEAVEARSDYGFRWGSFYSNRLVGDVLGLDATDGVIRVSLCHYNTVEEVEGFVKVLDEVLSS